MAILRKEPVGFDGEKTIYDILADQKSDLTAMTAAGVGSMAYTRTADNDNQLWVKTAAGWVALDA